MTEDTLPAPSTELVLATELRRLRNEVRALADWWDVLPQESSLGVRIPWEQVFANETQPMRLRGQNMSTTIELIVSALSDRLHLRLRVDLVIVWERTIFYGRPFIGQLVDVELEP